MTRARLLLLLLLPALFCAAATFAADMTATTPTDRPDQKWWAPRHAEKVKAAAGLGEKCKIVFLGDSITFGLERGPHHARYDKLNPLFLGFSGDQTQQVLWRLDHGEWPESVKPAATVLMIGTNNTGAGRKPEDTAAGVQAVVDSIHRRSPKTAIILFAIFPRGATAQDKHRLTNDAVNKLISGLKSRDYIRFVDIGANFMKPNGDLLGKQLMPDLLHPNADGQKIWADAIDKELKSLGLF